jgi:hypothetical protein
VTAAGPQPLNPAPAATGARLIPVDKEAIARYFLYLGSVFPATGRRVTALLNFQELALDKTGSL